MLNPRLRDALPVALLASAAISSPGSAESAAAAHPAMGGYVEAYIGDSPKLSDDQLTGTPEACAKVALSSLTQSAERDYSVMTFGDRQSVTASISGAVSLEPVWVHEQPSPTGFAADCFGTRTVDRVVRFGSKKAPKAFMLRVLGTNYADIQYAEERDVTRTCRDKKKITAYISTTVRYREGVLSASKKGVQSQRVRCVRNDQVPSDIYPD